MPTPNPTPKAINTAQHKHAPIIPAVIQISSELMREDGLDYQNI